jgi:hypothetical protein
MANPYHLFGLQRNPFVIEQSPGVSENLWVERSLSCQTPKAKNTTFVQVIGDKGAGKTSLMIHWQRMIPGPYFYVPRTYHRFFLLPPLKDIVYWDEVDRMPLWTFLLYLTIAKIKGYTIVCGTHKNLTTWAKLWRFQVYDVSFPPLDVEIVYKWAWMRIMHASITDAPPSLPLSKKIVAELLKKSGNCWRRVGDELHKWTASVVLSYQKSNH